MVANAWVRFATRGCAAGREAAQVRLAAADLEAARVRFAPAGALVGRRRSWHKGTPATRKERDGCVPGACAPMSQAMHPDVAFIIARGGGGCLGKWDPIARDAASVPGYGFELPTNRSDPVSTQDRRHSAQRPRRVPAGRLESRRGSEPEPAPTPRS